MPQPVHGLDNSTENMQKNLDHEIRDMISTLTHRLTNLQRLQKPAEDHQDHHLDDLEPDRGVRIITLAGNNVGATMRGELDDKSNTTTGGNPGQTAPTGGENEGLSTYVNSNFQAINNSIMMGGSYTAQDPGVHMDISDCLENKASSSASHDDDEHASGHDKKGKKKKKHSKSENDQEPKSD